jgi:hypothetical protein
MKPAIDYSNTVLFIYSRCIELGFSHEGAIATIGTNEGLEASTIESILRG